MRLLDLVRYMCLLTCQLIYQRIIYPLFISRQTNAPMMVNANITNSPFRSNPTLANTLTGSTASGQSFSSTTSTPSTFARLFSSAFSSSPYGNSGPETMAAFNNILKWFYLNMDTTNRINNTILNILNFNFSGTGQRPMSVRF